MSDSTLETRLTQIKVDYKGLSTGLDDLLDNESKRELLKCLKKLEKLIKQMTNEKTTIFNWNRTNKLSHANLVTAEANAGAAKAYKKGATANIEAFDQAYEDAMKEAKAARTHRRKSIANASVATAAHPTGGGTTLTGSSSPAGQPAPYNRSNMAPATQGIILQVPQARAGPLSPNRTGFHSPEYEAEQNKIASKFAQLTNRSSSNIQSQSNLNPHSKDVQTEFKDWSPKYVTGSTRTGALRSSDVAQGRPIHPAPYQLNDSHSSPNLSNISQHHSPPTEVATQSPNALSVAPWHFKQHRTDSLKSQRSGQDNQSHTDATGYFSPTIYPTSQRSPGQEATNPPKSLPPMPQVISRGMPSSRAHFSRGQSNVVPGRNEQVSSGGILDGTGSVSGMHSAQTGMGGHVNSHSQYPFPSGAARPFRTYSSNEFESDRFTEDDGRPKGTRPL